MSRDPDIFPPTERPVNALRTYENNINVNPFSPFIERLRRKTVDERNRYLGALRSYIEEKERINHAIVNYENSMVRLRNLDQIRETEAKKLRAELDRVELDAIEGLELAKSRMLLEKLELEAKVIAAQERVDRLKNPPQKQEKADPVKSRIDATLHGGRYAKHTEEEIQKIFKQYGGEQNVPPDVMERIRNARRHAAMGDEGQG
jgi:hypothetical protein